MERFLRRTGWTVVIVLATIIGIYPFLYYVTDMTHGLMSTKSDALRENVLWQSVFYIHITTGGIAMLLGWSQFSTGLKQRFTLLHRTLGKSYVAACLLAGSAGLFLAFFATGGLISGLGFGMLALFWIIATTRAYLYIRQGRIEEHRRWMMRSYALTFAAVMLRIWFPLSQFTGMEYIPAYRISAWLCWVPNLIFVEILISRIGMRKAKNAMVGH